MKRTLLVHALDSVRTESRNQRPVRLVCRHSAAGIWSHVAVVCSATLFALVCALALSRSLALTLFRALSLLFATVQSHVSRIGFRSCQTRSNRFSCIEAQVVGDRILSLSKTDIALVPNKLGLFRRHRFSSQCQTYRRAKTRQQNVLWPKAGHCKRFVVVRVVVVVFVFELATTQKRVLGKNRSRQKLFPGKTRVVVANQPTKKTLGGVKLVFANTKTFLWQKNLVSPTKTCFWQQNFSLAEKPGVANKNLFSATKLFFGRSMVSPTKSCFRQQKFSLAEAWCRQQKVVFGNKTFLWQKHGVANKKLFSATKIFFGRSMVSPTKSCFRQQNFSLAEAWCRQQKVVFGNKTFLWQKHGVANKNLLLATKLFFGRSMVSPTKTCFWQQNFSLAEKPGALANKNLFSATRCFIFGQWSVNRDFNRWL